MLILGLMLLWFQTAPRSEDAILRDITESGRCATVAETPDERVTTKPTVAPGQPPLFSFRYYEGRQHFRFGNSDLMLDDAGH